MSVPKNIYRAFLRKYKELSGIKMTKGIITPIEKPGYMYHNTCHDFRNDTTYDLHGIYPNKHFNVIACVKQEMRKNSELKLDNMFYAYRDINHIYTIVNNSQHQK